MFIRRSGALTTNLCRVGGLKKENTPLNKWAHPPSLWRRLLETKRPHEYRIQWLIDRTLLTLQCTVCVCVSSLRRCATKTECSQCKNIKVTGCSCRLEVSVLKPQKHKIKKPLLVEPAATTQSPQPKCTAQERGGRTQDARGSPTRSCPQLLFREREKKLHQRAESQLIFPNPKTVEILTKRVRT